MQRLFIFLSIALVFTLFQYSNGAPTNPFLSESEEDNSVETINANEFEPIDDGSDESDEATIQPKSLEIPVHENDQSSEEMHNSADVLEPTRKVEELNSHEVEDDDAEDDQIDVANIVNDDYGRILEDDDDDDQN